MFNIRRAIIIVLVSLSMLVISLLLGQLLGVFYIYNMLQGDNSENINTYSAQVEKLKVLRLDLIKFYTIQVGIYEDAQNAQANIDKLVEKGLQPFVSSGPPYKIWVGCFSEKDSANSLEDYLEKTGFEVFISEGLVNDHALKFPASNSFMADNFSPLLGNYNLVLNHSLKMFKSPWFSDYEEQVWLEMINKIQGEITRAVSETEKIMQMEEGKNYIEELTLLKEKVIAYGNSLKIITETKGDGAVLQSQGYLLRLIDTYHSVIEEVTKKLLKN